MLEQPPAMLAHGPWSDRALVHKATGMIVAQLSIGPEDARAFLQARAFAEGRGLAHIAAALIDRRLSFTDPDTAIGHAPPSPDEPAVGGEA
ncbi:ANTAR domain-containing protein [Cellulomonas humilata]|uniref:ANTAR domain-containing protein n=1 Tax=Cellulomonas humilata TaxID=144055 RepID=A0ABU0EME1_9CELL|nr:ANTAR domain-containing protein [Cellulomonas humilata]MDQ0375982.1 hypothetical protein [Cellulomonas humilata]